MQRSKALELFLHSQANPVFWINSVLGADPWAKQIEIVNSVRDNPRTAVASAHGVGKSWVAARIALWWLLCHPGSIVAVTAPTYRQVERILWQEIRKAYKGAKIPLGPEPLKTSLTITDGWYAFGFSTDDSTRFQGLHAEHVLVIFDEAAGVAPEIWTAAEGVLTSEHCRFLAIGNPTESSGPFYEMFRDATVHKIHISAFDIPNVAMQKTVVPGLTTYEWVEDKKVRWGENSQIYRSRVLGEFPTNSASTVIPLSWVEAAVERGRLARASKTALPPVTTAGLDVSDGGEDRTFLARKRGNFYDDLVDLTQSDPFATMAVLASAKQYVGSATLIVDAIGCGSGIVSRAQEERLDVYGFVASKGTERKDETGDQGFINCRAAAWWGFREMLNPNSGLNISLPDDNELLAELTEPRWMAVSGGRIKIEEKSEIRKRLGRSPDKADAVIMAAWISEQPKVANVASAQMKPSVSSSQHGLMRPRR